MFKKVKMGQEEPFKGNSGELGLFSNGRAEGNSRCVVYHMMGGGGGSIPLTERLKQKAC